MFYKAFARPLNKNVSRCLQGFHKAFTTLFSKSLQCVLYKCSYNVFQRFFTRLSQCFVQGVCKDSAVCFARCLHGFYTVTGCLQRSPKVFTMLLQGFRNAFYNVFTRRLEGVQKAFREFLEGF